MGPEADRSHRQRPMAGPVALSRAGTLVERGPRGGGAVVWRRDDAVAPAPSWRTLRRGRPGDFGAPSDRFLTNDSGSSEALTVLEPHKGPNRCSGRLRSAARWSARYPSLGGPHDAATGGGKPTVHRPVSAPRRMPPDERFGPFRARGRASAEETPESLLRNG